MTEFLIYMFKDKESIIKSGIFYLLIFVSVAIISLAQCYIPQYALEDISVLFFVYTFLGILVLFLPCGYGVLSVKNLIDKNDKLPDFDFSKIFMQGFKLLVSALILTFFICLLYFILYLFAIVFHKYDIVPLSFIVSVCGFLIIFLVSFFLMASTYNFAKTNDILSFVRLKELCSLINKNVNQYFICYIPFIVLTIFVLYVGSCLKSVLIFFGYAGLFAYSIIYSLVLVYTILVGAKLIANSIKE